MSMRLGTKTIACVLLFVLTICGTSFSQISDGADTSYIGSDTFFTIVIRPTQLIKFAEDKATRDAVLDLMQRESGVNVRKLDELVVQFGNENISETDERSFLRSDEFVSMVFRFSEPIEREAVVSKMFNNATTATHQKMTYYKPQSKHQPSGFFPNDQTLVIAKEPRLRKMMTEKHSMGFMVSRLRKAGMGNDLFAVASISSGRELSLEAVKVFDLIGGGELPISPAEIVRMVDDAVVKVNLSNDVPIQLNAKTASDEAAVEVQKQLSALLALGKTVFPGARQSILDSVPSEKIGNLSVDVIEAVLAGTKVEVQGSEISIRVKKDGGLPQLVELFSQSIGQETKRAVLVEDVEATAVPADAPAPE